SANVSTSLGAKKVYVAFIHPLLVGSALDKIMLAGASLVVATDSIESPISKISIAPVVAQALKRLMS
ncbi:MAG: ribose-phosphate pyrophosphokinase, partial [Candidatus Methanomethylicota archaeon]